jgi:hypothetical protein
METLLIILVILVLLGVIPLGSRLGWSGTNNGLVRIIVIVVVVLLILRLI